MKKRWIVAVVCGLMFSFSLSLASLAAEGQWISDGGRWLYEDQMGNPIRNSWQLIGGKWYRFDRDGYMAVGWTKVNGYDYYFRDTGELAVGWCYNDEQEKWYYFNEDGTAQKDWLQFNGDWYWFNVKGQMESDGFRTIGTEKYYFNGDGRMASNQYVGLEFIGTDGLRNKDYDITIEDAKKTRKATDEEEEQITEALQVFPREWIRYFVDHGWRFLYYTEKEYLSAPNTDIGVYYMLHRLDTSYRKIKFCDPQSLRRAFGEYIGYASGAYQSGSEFESDLSVYHQGADEFVQAPDYYSEDSRFYFGRLMELYLDGDRKEEMLETIPELCADLDKALQFVNQK